MSTFVLVHGAFRGGSSWDWVAAGLRSMGHTVHAPSLTGMGDRAEPRPERVTLADWVHDLVTLVDADRLERVLLVGHSQGGLVITAASQRLTDRLERLVFLDAPAPAPGQRGVDLTPLPPGVSMPALPPADTWIEPTPPPADGFEPSRWAWLAERLCATPFGPSLDPVVLDESIAAAIPRSFAFCTGTPPGYPSTATRALLDRAGTPYELFEAPHDVIVTHPEQVTAWLHRLAGPGAG